MENTIIAREHSFTNKGLKTATNRIIKATEQTAKSLMTIALTMVEIEEKELYKDDFSSVVEYGEKVFGYKKSAVYNMLKVGRQYLLPDTQKSIFAEEDGTDFTFNQLSRLLPLPSVEVATELVENETITPDMTLRQIEDAVKAYNHKDEETDAEGETDAEETSETDTEERTSPEIIDDILTLCDELKPVYTRYDINKLASLMTVTEWFKTLKRDSK